MIKCLLYRSLPPSLPPSLLFLRLPDVLSWVISAFARTFMASKLVVLISLPSLNLRSFVPPLCSTLASAPSSSLMLPSWLLRRGLPSYQNLAPPSPSSTDVAAASPPSLRHSSLKLVVTACLFFVLRHRRTFSSSLSAATTSTTTSFLLHHGKPLSLFSVSTEKTVGSLGGLEAAVVGGTRRRRERERAQGDRETRESAGRRGRRERKSTERKHRGER